MGEIYTIGHSTRAIEEFISILQTYEIVQLIDIRTIPKSRHNPQYMQETLSKSLEAVKINYVYMPNLGGLRPTSKDSVNMGWRNASFRGYADYMQTKQFDEAVTELIQLAATKRSAIMCAEAVPWRCHRSLVGDALLQREFTVTDIISSTSVREHTLTAFARVEDGRITYPPEEEV